MKRAVLVGLLAVVAAPAMAQSEIGGSMSWELRTFLEAPAFPGQPATVFYRSATADLRLTHDLPSGSDRLVLAPFLRFGGNGDGRNHADLREAYWLHQGDGWTLTAGIDRVFWGVTESRHLVDIVNQVDGLEDIDGEDKLGQPMVAVSITGEHGTLSLFALPWFRPLKLPEFPARLGGPAPLLKERFDPGDGIRKVDLAARWSQTFGDFDVALSYFRGKDREPRLVPSAGGFVPRYDRISQAGLEAQYTSGDWLWKLEAIRRTGQGPAFWAATGGFEWTLYGVGGSNADLALFTEYSRDARDPAQAPPTIFDNDLFLGARIAFNDIGDTALTIGALVDMKSDARVMTVDLASRLNDDWQVSLEGRLITGSSPSDPSAPIRADDYLGVAVKRYF